MSLARRSLQVVAFVCTLIVGVTSMAVIVTQTTWFKEWLRGFIVRQAEDYVNGRLSWSTRRQPVLRRRARRRRRDDERQERGRL
jgi:hypothetical protein